MDSMKVMAMTAEVRSGEWDQMKELITEVEKIQLPSLLWFVLPDGSYYMVDLNKTDQNLSDRDYSPGLMKGEVQLGSLVVGKTSGRKSLVVTVPVKKDRAVTGGLGVSILLDSLSELLVDQMDLPADMKFYTVNGDGEVALHSDTTQILAEAPDLPDAVVSETSELIRWECSLGFK